MAALDSRCLTRRVIGERFDLQVHRFDARVWTPFGNLAGFVFSAQELALNSAGNPVIAYKQGFAASNAEALPAAESNGTAWTQPRASCFHRRPQRPASIPLGNPPVAPAVAATPHTGSAHPAHCHPSSCSAMSAICAGGGP